jgi:MFS family permease
MADSAVEESQLTATVCTVRRGRPRAQQATRRSTRAHRLGRDLRSSVGDAAGCGVMVGTGETYLPAFVLAAGLGDVIAGLVASVPQLAGGIAQLICPRGVRLLGSHRRWVVTCAAIQGLSFVPLVIAAWQGTVSATLVLAVAVLYWSAGLASSPPWNTWMGTVVPGLVRSRYFARRARIQQGAVLIGFLAAGAAIEFGATSENALAGFGLLFALAVACRFASVSFLARTSEPEPMPSNVRHIPLPALMKRFCRGAEAQRLLYISLVQGAAYVASPYFAPYMLRVLKLSYAEYVVLISTAYVAKVVSLSLWGGVAARFGVRKLLWIGGIGIVPSAGAWLISNQFWFLMLVQLASGTAWAAYELAVFLISFNSIRAEERTSVLTVFNLTTTAAMVVGSLLGAGVLVLFGATRPVYFILFGGSSLLRLGTLFFLRRVPARLIEPLTGGRAQLPQQTRSFLPFRPFLAALSQTDSSPSEWIDPSSEPLRRPA